MEAGTDIHAIQCCSFSSFRLFVLNPKPFVLNFQLLCRQDHFRLLASWTTTFRDKLPANICLCARDCSKRSRAVLLKLGCIQMAFFGRDLSLRVLAACQQPHSEGVQYRTTVCFCSKKQMAMASSSILPRSTPNERLVGCSEVLLFLDIKGVSFQRFFSMQLPLCGILIFFYRNPILGNQAYDTATLGGKPAASGKGPRQASQLEQHHTSVRYRAHAQGRP